MFANPSLELVNQFVPTCKAILMILAVFEVSSCILCSVYKPVCIVIALSACNQYAFLAYAYNSQLLYNYMYWHLEKLIVCVGQENSKLFRLIQ